MPCIVIVSDPETPDDLGDALQRLGARVVRSSVEELPDHPLADLYVAGASQACPCARALGAEAPLIAIAGSDDEAVVCENGGAPECLSAHHPEALLARALFERAARGRSECDAKHAGKRLDDFVYAASHDLTSSLISVVGFLTQTRRALDERAVEKALESIEPAERAAKKISQMIDGLRSISRISGEDGHAERIDLSMFAEQVWGATSTRLLAGGVAFEADERLPSIVAERRLITSLLDALFSNAIMYGCEKGAGEVSFGSQERDGQTVFVVSDRGPGVDEAQRSRVFDLFVQMNRAPEAGVGVGLPLARRVVDRYAGDMWIEDASPSGACVLFTLPACMNAQGIGARPTAAA